MSPELALVDAGLAAQLRAIPDAPMRYLALTPPAGDEHKEPACDPVECTTDAPIARVDEPDSVTQAVEQERLAEPRMLAHEHDYVADLVVQEETPHAERPMSGTPEDHPSADLVVYETDEQAELSGYPALPSPTDGEEPSDATETVLREIRNRLTPPTSVSRRRRFRRRFTVASGLGAAIALGALATTVRFGVTQLPV